MLGGVSCGGKEVPKEKWPTPEPPKTSTSPATETPTAQPEQPAQPTPEVIEITADEIHDRMAELKKTRYSGEEYREFKKWVESLIGKPVRLSGYLQHVFPPGWGEYAYRISLTAKPEPSGYAPRAISVKVWFEKEGDYESIPFREITIIEGKVYDASINEGSGEVVFELLDGKLIQPKLPAN